MEIWLSAVEPATQQTTDYFYDISLLLRRAPTSKSLDTCSYSVKLHFKSHRYRAADDLYLLILLRQSLFYSLVSPGIQFKPKEKGLSLFASLCSRSNVVSYGRDQFIQEQQQLQVILFSTHLPGPRTIPSRAALHRAWWQQQSLNNPLFLASTASDPVASSLYSADWWHNSAPFL